MSPVEDSEPRELPGDSSVDDDRDRRHGASLRSKLVLSLAAVFFVFLTVDELVRQRFLQPAFHALERGHATNDAMRVLTALMNEKAHLCELSGQLAAQLPPSFPNEMRAESASEISYWWESAIQSDSISTVHRVDFQGQWRRSPWILTTEGPKLSSRQVSELPWISEPAPLDHQDFERLAQLAGRTSVTDVIREPGGDLVMYAIHAISPPEPMGTASIDLQDSMDSELPPKEFLVARRIIDETFLDQIRDKTRVEFALQAAKSSKSKQRLHIWEANDETLVVEFPLRNTASEPVANVFVPQPRGVVARVTQATSLARNQFVFGSVAALLLLLLLLQRIVITPIRSLQERTHRIAEQGLLADPTEPYANDEIGKLGEAFDHMVLRLRQSQLSMSQSSRAAGMSQVASTVVHNIGNVLTNVNSLLESIEHKVGSLRVEPLSSLADRLRDPDMDSELIEQAPQYLQALSKSLKSDRDDLVDLLGALHDNLYHIHDVIREQRRHTNAELVAQESVVDDLLREAIRCCDERLKQHEIRVQVQGDTDSVVQTDQSILLQVLINVIANAQEAFASVRDRERCIHIDVKESVESVRIRISDNASGMTPDTLKQLFDAHYTTRKSGSGLGLHFCSLSIARLGGRIEASSSGPDQGSTFTIWLPTIHGNSLIESTNSTHAEQKRLTGQAS